jgi:hypothetical protein
MNRTDRVLHNPDRSCATYINVSLNLPKMHMMVILRQMVSMPRATGTDQSSE